METRAISSLPFQRPLSLLNIPLPLLLPRPPRLRALPEPLPPLIRLLERLSQLLLLHRLEVRQVRRESRA